MLLHPNCSELITEIDISNAEEALNILNNDNYDALVSDYAMKGMNGLELLKILREEGNSIPFILLTGRGSEEIEKEARNLGVDGYIPKSLDIKNLFTELIEKIEKTTKQLHQ